MPSWYTEPWLSLGHLLGNEQISCSEHPFRWCDSESLIVLTTCRTCEVQGDLESLRANMLESNQWRPSLNKCMQPSASISAVWLRIEAQLVPALGDLSIHACRWCKIRPGAQMFENCARVSIASVKGQRSSWPGMELPAHQRNTCFAANPWASKPRTASQQLLSGPPDPSCRLLSHRQLQVPEG